MLIGNRRLVGLTFACAMAAFATAASANDTWPPAGEPVPAWAREIQVEDNWIFAGETEGRNAEVFISPAPAETGVRVWERMEIEASDSRQTFLSFVSLLEVDCQQRRYRSIQSVGYTGRNLSGRNEDISSTGEWRTGGPRTIGENEVALACQTPATAAPAKAP